MKTSNFKLQTLLIFSFLISQSLFAQLLNPAASEQKYNGSSAGVRNTGTDMILLEDDCVLQVSVWDGDNSGFGWIKSSGQSLDHPTFNGTTRYFALLPDGELKDPDVVIAKSSKNDNKIYAKVVGIDNQNFARTYTFLWTGTGFTFEGTCKYGAAWEENNGTFASGYSYGRKCSSPNIDANADGETVITWTETEEYAVETILGFPFPQPNSEFLRLKRGNVLGHFGDISDICFNCTTSRIVFQYTEPNTLNIFNFSIANSIPGFSVLDPNIYPTSDIEIIFPAGWFAHSDVSISEHGGNKDRSVISFVFYEYKYFGGTSNPLFVNQFFVNSEQVCPKFEKSWNSFFDYPGGRPRIASPTKLTPGELDFHVVLGFSGASTDCDGNYSETSNLSLLGVRGGIEINGGQAINILTNDDLTESQNSEPAISYIMPDQNGTEEYILVTWTHKGSLGIDKGEIIAKLYKPGDGTPLSSSYSIVNEMLTENQYVSSVAARRAEEIAAYFWAESGTDALECKFSRKDPGIEELSSFVTCQEIPPGENPESVGIIVAPNPTNGEISIKLSEPANQKNIELVELIGPTGQKMKVSYHRETQMLNPNGKLIPGMYKLRVITPSETYQKNLLVQ